MGRQQEAMRLDIRHLVGGAIVVNVADLVIASNGRKHLQREGVWY